MTVKLFEHQTRGVELGKEGNKAFFWDCGTGKTCLGLNIIKYWKSMGQGPALIVCPLNIVESAWIEDQRKFAPELSIVSVWGRNLPDKKWKLRQKCDVCVCNYDTVKGLYYEIAAKNFKVIIVDESSVMKNPSSQITRSLLSFAGVKTRGKDGVSFPVQKVIPHRYILSGTPAPNDQSEYWGQIKFITGPGDYIFDENFFVFRAKYFSEIRLGMYRSMWKFKSSKRKEFNGELLKVAQVIAKSDVLDLPEQSHVIRYIELSRDERNAYNTMTDDLVLRFSDEDVLASTDLVEIMKLRQLTSGFCYGENTHQIGASKLTELQSLLDEIGNHQVIIWCNFKYEIRQLLDTIPYSGALWSESEDKEQTIEQFKDNRIRYLIAHPLSGAHGLTFTNCSYAIYYSLNYSYELQKQSEDRIHRIGQTLPCTYYYFLARKTIDEIIYKAVGRKEQVSENILGWLRERGTQ